MRLLSSKNRHACSDVRTCWTRNSNTCVLQTGRCRGSRLWLTRMMMISRHVVHSGSGAVTLARTRRRLRTTTSTRFTSLLSTARRHRRVNSVISLCTRRKIQTYIRALLVEVRHARDENPGISTCFLTSVSPIATKLGTGV